MATREAPAEREPTFQPNYAVHPGGTLEEWLEEQGMAQTELASRIDMSTKALNQIIREHKPISQATALKLELVTAIPAKTWNGLQALYSEDAARIAQATDLAAQVEFLKQVPVTAMRKIGLVSAPNRDKVAVLREVCNFFGVVDPQAWGRVWHEPIAVFRRSSVFSERPGATAAWLRMGELVAQKVESEGFDKAALEQILPQLRALTRASHTNAMLMDLQRLCASAGVALVVVPDAFGSRCSGATRWIAGRPLVQLSMRYRHDDQFWFTVFHELGHVLLHGRNELFIDDGPATAERRAYEKQADKFASDLLIPVADAKRLRQHMSLAEIEAFAAQTGVSAGIVVGRMQHEGLLPRSHGNGLKRQYDAPAAAA